MKKKPSFDDIYDDHQDYYNKPSDGLISCLNSFKVIPGKALDIGCGQGRNAIWLAKNGYDVDAFDTAINAVEKLSDISRNNHLKINAFSKDLCKYNMHQDYYDLIVVQTTLNHVDPSFLKIICSNIENALKINGFLYAVCFTEEDPAYTGKVHIESECSKYVQYYFKKNELKKMFNKLHALYYREYMKIDTGHGQDHFHGKAKLIAQKRK